MADSAGARAIQLVNETLANEFELGILAHRPGGADA
jgi:hypothetical protein